MIVAKTTMKKIPESCNKCKLSCVEHRTYTDTSRYCLVTLKECPMERSEHKNMKYVRHDWCPLTEIGKCKDCIHYEFGVCLQIYEDGNVSADSWQKRKPDDFCSYFEPKTSAKNYSDKELIE